jgi:hypothetical protein
MIVYGVPLGAYLGEALQLRTFDDRTAAEVWALKNDAHVVYEMRQVSTIDRTATVKRVL